MFHYLKNINFLMMSYAGEEVWAFHAEVVREIARMFGRSAWSSPADSMHVRQVSLIITCRLHACSTGQLDHPLPIVRMFGRSAWSSPADSTHARQVSLIITCRLHSCSAGQLDHQLPIARMFGRSAWSSPADCTHVRHDHKLISCLDRSQPIV